MIKYILYGYMSGVTLYKIYGYWEICSTAYSISRYVYKSVFSSPHPHENSSINLDPFEWDVIDEEVL